MRFVETSIFTKLIKELMIDDDYRKFQMIYYWDKANETFYMLFTYPKSKQDDLTPEQLHILCRVMKEEFL